MICGLTCIFILLAIDHALKPNSAQDLKSTSNCTCPGQTLIYLCTIEDNSGATVWAGTAFDCPETDNQLIFFHARRFIDSSRGCNDGAVTARGVSIVGNNYTSQVEVSVDPSMDGKSVTCLFNNGSSVAVIGNTSISIVKDPYPPPLEDDVSVIISDISNGPLNLTFKWTPVAVDCTAIRYVTEFDCGSCPNITDNTQVVCKDIVLGSQCRFTVQTQVCDSIAGNKTDVSINLKAPDSPNVREIVPTYSHEKNYLTALTVVFNETESFEIYSEISSSSTSYTLAFIEGSSQNICFLSTIKSSAALLDNSGSCYSLQFNYNNSCRGSTSDVTITFYATNVLGKGEAYNQTLDLYNVDLEVKFDDNYAQVTCKLIPWRRYHLESTFNCSIIYGIMGNSFESTFFTTGNTKTDTVILELSTTLFPKIEYQFSVLATYRNLTTVVEGTFIINEALSTRVSSPFTVSTLVFGAVTGSMGVMLIIATTIAIISTTMICITLYIYKRKGSALSSDAMEDTMSMSHISTERNVAYESVHALQVTQAS